MKFAPGVDVIATAAIVLLLSGAPALAYLDPASGGALSATILAFFAAIVFTFRKYFYKLTRLVKNVGRSSKTGAE